MKIPSGFLGILCYCLMACLRLTKLRVQLYHVSIFKHLLASNENYKLRSEYNLPKLNKLLLLLHTFNANLNSSMITIFYVCLEQHANGFITAKFKLMIIVGFWQFSITSTKITCQLFPCWFPWSVSCPLACLFFTSWLFTLILANDLLFNL